MMLYVVRHGVAEEIGPDGDDRSRRLTPSGRRKMRIVAAGLRTLGVRLDVLLASPMVRAAETAAIIAEVLDHTPSPRELPALAQGVPPVETARALHAFVRHDNVAIVGHEPGLSGLVALLLTGSAEGLRLVLKKGGVVALEMRDPGRRGAATMRWLLTPRQLRRLGRRPRI
jgi:phosphohistidine phosphatase